MTRLDHRTTGKPDCYSRFSSREAVDERVLWGYARDFETVMTEPS